MALIRRKKYNKIILISIVGTDYEGIKFIDEARKIIGNDVIILFLAYNIKHLDWIKNYKNSLFSNKPEFYEYYLNCFSEEYPFMTMKKLNILKLKKETESHYKVQFNFDDKFLDYPKYKDNGSFSEFNILDKKS